MPTTLDALRTILMRDYPIASDRLTLDASLEGLGIDSLGAAELLFTVEDEFKVTVPSEPVVLLTVGDVVRFIDGLILAQRDAVRPGAGVAPMAPAVPALPALPAS